MFDSIEELPDKNMETTENKENPNDFDITKDKRKQKLMVIITIILLVALIVIFIKPEEKENIPFSMEDKNNRIAVSDITNGAKLEDRWMQISERRLQELTDTLAAREKENERLQEKIKDMEEAVHDYTENQKKIVSQSEFLTEIESLRSELATLKSNPSSAAGPIPAFGNYNSMPGDGSVMPSRGIEVTDLTLLEDSQNMEISKKTYNTKTYLPAGSYAPAIVVSGVNASVGISSQSDPRPMLLRVVGPAISSIYEGEEQKIDITGCIVNGAASGDLSSEKVFVRLLKMTCSNSNGEIVETDVEGYVAAAGKAGIRGPVTSREGNLITKSFLSGIVSGFGGALSDKMTTPVTADAGGFITQSPSTKEIVGQGFGSGISKASDRLSDYLIERAEQYQPVISVAAGTKVELVFNSGVYLDGRLGNDITNN